MTDMQTITITNLHGEEEEVTVPVTLIPMEELAEEELAAGRICLLYTSDAADE